MFRRLTTFIALTVFAGVALTSTGWFGTPRQKLIGHWAMTLDVNAADVRGANASENPLTAAFTSMLMRTVQAEFDVVFRGDETATMTMSFLGNSYERHAYWRIVKSEGDATTVSLQFSESAPATEWVVKFLDDNSFQSTPPVEASWAANKSVVFRRLKQD